MLCSVYRTENFHTGNFPMWYTYNICTEKTNKHKRHVQEKKKSSRFAKYVAKRRNGTANWRRLWKSSKFKCIRRKNATCVKRIQFYGSTYVQKMQVTWLTIYGDLLWRFASNFTITRNISCWRIKTYRCANRDVDSCRSLYLHSQKCRMHLRGALVMCVSYFNFKRFRDTLTILGLYIRLDLNRMDFAYCRRHLIRSG